MRPRWNYPRLLLAGLLLALTIALVVAASTSSVAFAVYNPSWEGTSNLESQADAVGVESRVLLNTSAYTNASNGTVSVIVSPDTRYSEEDRQRLRGFVHRGGTLIIAEDYGERGNDLLQAVGAQARVDGRPLRDERTYYRSPAMPVAPVNNESNYTAGVKQLTFNHGTFIHPHNATVAVESSEFSYADKNGNGELDERELLKSRPILTVETVGDGRVIVVSDASLFINAMIERPGNRRFIRNIFDHHERVFLDTSHASSHPPLAIGRLHLQRTPLLQVAVGLVALGLIAGWSRRRRNVLCGPDDENDLGNIAYADIESLTSYITERYPDWDETRIRRVIAGIKSRQGENETNEWPR